MSAQLVEALRECIKFIVWNVPDHVLERQEADHESVLHSARAALAAAEAQPVPTVEQSASKSVQKRLAVQTGGAA